MADNKFLEDMERMWEEINEIIKETQSPQNLKLTRPHKLEQKRYLQPSSMSLIRPRAHLSRVIEMRRHQA